MVNPHFHYDRAVSPDSQDITLRFPPRQLPIEGPDRHGLVSSIDFERVAENENRTRWQKRLIPRHGPRAVDLHELIITSRTSPDRDQSVVVELRAPGTSIALELTRGIDDAVVAAAVSTFTTKSTTETREILLKHALRGAAWYKDPAADQGDLTFSLERNGRFIGIMDNALGVKLILGHRDGSFAARFDGSLVRNPRRGELMEELWRAARPLVLNPERELPSALKSLTELCVYYREPLFRLVHLRRNAALAEILPTLSHAPHVTVEHFESHSDAAILSDILAGRERITVTHAGNRRWKNSPLAFSIDHHGRGFLELQQPLLPTVRIMIPEYTSRAQQLYTIESLALQYVQSPHLLRRALPARDRERIEQTSTAYRARSCLARWLEAARDLLPVDKNGATLPRITDPGAVVEDSLRLGLKQGRPALVVSRPPGAAMEQVYLELPTPWPLRGIFGNSVQLPLANAANDASRKQMLRDLFECPAKHSLPVQNGWAVSRFLTRLAFGKLLLGGWRFTSTVAHTSSPKT